jgi:Ca2+-binding EF-hand superfamily protein
MSNRINPAASAIAAVMALALAGTAAAQATAPAAASKPRIATPDETFALWDKDKNKALSLEEFKAGYQQVQAQGAVRKLHQNFVAMDKNKSNAIEQDEFANLELVKKSGSKAPAFSSVDTDKNGKLDFKEYVSLIETMVRAK